MDPVVVKTVSKKSVSDEKLMNASLLVLKEFFLHEKIASAAKASSNRNDLFIEFRDINTCILLITEIIH